MNENLKEQLVKLGSTNPELRPHIREVLASITSNHTLQDGIKQAYVDFGEVLLKDLASLLKKQREGSVQVGPSMLKLKPNYWTRNTITVTVHTGTIQKPMLRFDAHVDMFGIRGISYTAKPSDDRRKIGEDLWYNLVAEVINALGRSEDPPQYDF
jgi:hypothetical protein